MTGYGRADYSDNGISLTVELKTVNNRNFDLNLKTPRAFISLEDCIRKTVQQYVKRGRIDLFVNFSDLREKESTLEVNLDKVAGYIKAGKLIASQFNVQNDITTSLLMKFPEVIVDNSVADVTEFEEVVKNTVAKACENLNNMRQIEGQKLVDDMLNRMETIKSLADNIKSARH
jgi:uncharacterized protein (TIGR00255 family)